MSAAGRKGGNGAEAPDPFYSMRSEEVVLSGLLFGV